MQKVCSIFLSILIFICGLCLAVYNSNITIFICIILGSIMLLYCLFSNINQDKYEEIPSFSYLVNIVYFVLGMILILISSSVVSYLSFIISLYIVCCAIIRILYIVNFKEERHFKLFIILLIISFILGLANIILSLVLPSIGLLLSGIFMSVYGLIEFVLSLLFPTKRVTSKEQFTLTSQQ